MDVLKLAVKTLYEMLFDMEIAENESNHDEQDVVMTSVDEVDCSEQQVSETEKEDKITTTPVLRRARYPSCRFPTCKNSATAHRKPKEEICNIWSRTETCTSPFAIRTVHPMKRLSQLDNSLESSDESFDDALRIAPEEWVCMTPKRRPFCKKAKSMTKMAAMCPAMWVDEALSRIQYRRTLWRLSPRLDFEPMSENVRHYTTLQNAVHYYNDVQMANAESQEYSPRPEFAETYFAAIPDFEVSRMRSPMHFYNPHYFQTNG